jgi:Tol biopolymer transport system component
MDGRYPRNLNDIYAIDADGSNDRAIAITEEREFEPRLSPDGKRLLYLKHHIRADGRRSYVLFIKDIDGSADRPLFSIP